MFVNTPPMGWNTWNTFGPNISEQLVRESADKFIELGLDKAGYQYVVIDDCWSERQRDPVTHKILASREKFPNGMKAVADYIHAKGLKFGMYSCAGVRTCADYPGSFDHEFLDARTFAEFGCDFLKYDYCWHPGEHDTHLYRRMGNALRLCGRDILFSACNWGSDDVWSWIRSAGAHMYRSTGDIHDNFVSFRDIAKSQLRKYCFSGNNCFNDMDMLTVGMFGNGLVGIPENVLTLDQYQVQFALWCMMGSPLMLGCDIRKMTPEILALVTDRELIAIDQDPEVRPAFNTVPEYEEAGIWILSKLLSNGDLAVGFFNMSDVTPHDMPFYFERVGFPWGGGYDLMFKPVLNGEELGVCRECVNRHVKPRSCEVYRVTPVPR